MTSNHLFLFCLILIGFGVFQCNNPQNKPTKQDSINTAVSIHNDIQDRQIDSLFLWVYEVEKADRISEYHQRKDYERIIVKLDSIGRKEPRLRTICKALGDLAGGLLGLNVVGRVVK